MIPNNLKTEIETYCKANKIEDIDKFIIKLVKQGFTIEKYGSAPMTKEKIVEVEKIIEKIVEVEKRVEVPIAMIDTELSENLKKCIEIRDKALNDFKELNQKWVYTEEEYQKLKIKEEERNKKDFYGE